MGYKSLNMINMVKKKCQGTNRIYLRKVNIIFYLQRQTEGPSKSLQHAVLYLHKRITPTKQRVAR